MLNKLRLGTRFHEDKLEWRKSWEEEDIANGITVRANTLKPFSLLATSVLQCLKFTYDSPEANQSARMPVLDTEMWLGEEHRKTGIPEDALEAGDVLEEKEGPLHTVILFNFHKKKISNRIPNLEASASPVGQKIATTSQEIIRRLKNSSLDLPPP